MKKSVILVIFMMFSVASLNASDYFEGFKFYTKGHKLLNTNSDKAFKYFLEAQSHLLVAYKSNSANAAFMLGTMYCNGWGVDKNYDKAKKYCTDAKNWGSKRKNCCKAIQK